MFGGLPSPIRTTCFYFLVEALFKTTTRIYANHRNDSSSLCINPRCCLVDLSEIRSQLHDKCSGRSHVHRAHAVFRIQDVVDDSLETDVFGHFHA